MELVICLGIDFVRLTQNPSTYVMPSKKTAHLGQYLVK